MLIQFAHQVGMGEELQQRAERSIYEDDVIEERSETNALQLEINAYITQTTSVLAAPESFDVLKFWASAQAIFPILSELAKIILARQGSSTDSERTISTITWRQ